MIPLDLQLYFELAETYLQEKRFDDMRAILLRSVAVYPTLQALRTLGDVMMQKGEPAEAVRYYEKMRDFPQAPKDLLQNSVATSWAYFKDGDHEKAKLLIAEVLKSKGDYRPALELREEIQKAEARR